MCSKICIYERSAQRASMRHILFDLVLAEGVTPECPKGVMIIFENVLYCQNIHDIRHNEVCTR